MEKIITTFNNKKTLTIIFNTTDNNLANQVEKLTRKNKAIASVEVVTVGK